MKGGSYRPGHPGSGWLCYPGKLKRDPPGRGIGVLDQFRMALLSGEVETEIGTGLARIHSSGSGWLCYPGKLKHGNVGRLVGFD